MYFKPTRLLCDKSNMLALETSTFATALRARAPETRSPMHLSQINGASYNKLERVQQYFSKILL